ncbi:MAG: aldehyde dehydrogenase [Methylocystis sp.]|nr:MAG: aldehyde dehydrogenase [Methylocystis sp.]
MKEQEIIETLNNLVEISRDGEKGFRAAAEDVKDPKLKTVFSTAAERCASGARELESEITHLGGQPVHSSSTAGALHRAWVHLKAAVTGRSDRTILDEVERGEDVAKAAYEKAVAKPLPPQVRNILDRQYRGVKENHDLVRDLRNRAA